MVSGISGAPRVGRIALLTIGSTGSCRMGSSAIDVSVSAPLAREERGAILSTSTLDRAVRAPKGFFSRL